MGADRLGWPQEERELVAGPDCDHLQVLVQIVERLTQRIPLAQPVSAKFDLARVGRLLSHAVACQRDPDALQQSLDPRAGASDAVAGRPSCAGRVRRRTHVVPGWTQSFDDLAAATAALLQAGAVRTEPLVDPAATLACRDAVVGQLRELVGSVSEIPSRGPWTAHCWASTTSPTAGAQP